MSSLFFWFVYFTLDNIYRFTLPLILILQTGSQGIVVKKNPSQAQSQLVRFISEYSKAEPIQETYYLSKQMSTKISIVQIFLNNHPKLFTYCLVMLLQFDNYYYYKLLFFILVSRRWLRQFINYHYYYYKYYCYKKENSIYSMFNLLSCQFIFPFQDNSIQSIQSFVLTHKIEDNVSMC